MDSSDDAPSVEALKGDTNSIYNTVKELINLRHTYEDLQADAAFEKVYSEKGVRVLVYRRGDLLLAVNPGGEKISITTSSFSGNIMDVIAKEPIYKLGEERLAMTSS